MCGVGGSFAKPRKVEEPLVCYRHLPGASLAARTPRTRLLTLRLRAFECHVLDGWCGFAPALSGAPGQRSGLTTAEGAETSVHAAGDASSDKTSGCSVPGGPASGRLCAGKFVIWGAGRDGRAFYNALLPRYRERFVLLIPAL